MSPTMVQLAEVGTLTLCLLTRQRVNAMSGISKKYSLLGDHAKVWHNFMSYFKKEVSLKGVFSPPENVLPDARKFPRNGWSACCPLSFFSFDLRIWMIL